MTNILTRQQRRALKRKQKKQNRAPFSQRFHNELANVEQSNFSRSDAKSSYQAGWIPMGQTIEVASRKISGMIYFGNPPAIDSETGLDYKLRNFYINPELEVGDNSNSSKHEFSSTNIAYDQLTPIDRANYLDWLATDKSDTSYSDEYMVLYFMGLEQAFFDEKLTKLERAMVVAEIIRLYLLYANNKYNYLLLNLMSFQMCQNYPLEVFDAEDSFDHSDRRDLYCYHGGIKVLKNEPLKAGHVDTVLKFANIESIEKVRKICPYVFEKHFEAKFNQAYPNGLQIKKPAEIITVEYFLAFRDFKVEEIAKYMGEEIPDIEYSKEVQNVGKKIGELVAVELTQYTNEIEKDVKNIISKKQLEFLPRAKSMSKEKNFDQIIKSWVKEKLQRSDEITAENLALLLDFDFKEEESIILWSRLVVALERVGYAIAPDKGLFLYRIDQQTPISLFKLESTAEERQKSSGKYYTVLLSLVIGFLYLRMNNAVDDDESTQAKYLSLFADRIEAMNGLTDYETELLNANLESLQRVTIDVFFVLMFFDTGQTFDAKFVKESIKTFVGAGSKDRPEILMGTILFYKNLGFDPQDIASDLDLSQEEKAIFIKLKNMTSNMIREFEVFQK